MEYQYICYTHGHESHYEDCPVCRSYKNAPVKKPKYTLNEAGTKATVDPDVLEKNLKATSDKLHGLAKPRDLWLFMDSAVEYKHFGPQRVKQLGDRQIHLIEKTAYDELKSKADKLASTLEKSISTIQWVTNNCKLSETQHVKLGDQIAEIYDELKECRGEDEN